MHLPAGFLAGFRQGFKKHLPILSGSEYGFPAIPAIDDMINRPGIFDSEFSCHDAEFAPDKADSQ
jgi:hypothetical protein